MKKPRALFSNFKCEICAKLEQWPRFFGALTHHCSDLSPGSVLRASFGGYLKLVFLSNEFHKTAFFVLISLNIYPCTFLLSVKYPQTWRTAPHNANFHQWLLIFDGFLYFVDRKCKHQIPAVRSSTPTGKKWKSEQCCVLHKIMWNSAICLNRFHTWNLKTEPGAFFMVKIIT